MILNGATQYIIRFCKFRSLACIFLYQAENLRQQRFISKAHCAFWVELLWYQALKRHCYYSFNETDR